MSIELQRQYLEEIKKEIEAEVAADKEKDIMSV